MTWVSVEMLLWTVAVVAAGWLTPRRWQTAALGLMSVVFLAVHAPRSAALAVFCTLVSYFALAAGRAAGRRTLAAVAAIAAVLIWFKLGLNTDLASELGEPLVPLGLSYYALRAIHYVVERYKQTLEPHTIGEYVTYLVFFPMLLVGPISLFPDFQRDLRRRRWEAARFSRGLERVVHGYAKIVILGNYLVSIEMARLIANAYPPGSALGEYLDCLRFGLNLYFQFSGFSDVAIGVGLLLGFRLMENFRAPFLAPNISEFWRRWHISLSSWCRDYVYLPVASATRRPILGIFLSMMVIGLWHEISLRFLAWGLYHATGIAVSTAVERWKPAAWSSAGGAFAPVGRAAATLLTFNFVVVGFAFAKEPTLGAAMAAYKTMLGLG